MKLSELVKKFDNDFSQAGAAGPVQDFVRNTTLMCLANLAEWGSQLEIDMTKEDVMRVIYPDWKGDK